MQWQINDSSALCGEYQGDTPGGPDAEELKCITQLLNLFIYFSVFAMGSHYVARISLELALVTKLC